MVDNNSLQNANKENKKSIIILAIIAFITIVVVVAGATYAFLTSSIQEKGSTTVNATLSGSSDILTIQTGEPIAIAADEENLCESDGDNNCVFTGEGVSEDGIEKSTTATIDLKSNNVTAYNYEVQIKFSSENASSTNIQYTNGRCTPSAEVTDYVTKDSCPNTDDYLWENTTSKCYMITNPIPLNVSAINNELSCELQNYKWITDDTKPELELILSGPMGENGALDTKSYDITWGSEFIKNSGKCTTEGSQTTCKLATGVISAVQAKNYAEKLNYDAKVILHNLDGINQVANAGRSFNGELVVIQTGKVGS